MSIKRRGNEKDGNWFYRFNYKKEDYCEGGFPNKAQAEEAERLKRNAVINQAQHPEDYAGEMTFRQAGEWWLKEYAPSKRSHFVDEGRMPLMMDYFDAKLLKKILPADIDKFLRELPAIRAEKDLARGQKKQPMSDHTKNHYRALLHALYERLKQKKMYSGENPVSFVDKIQVPTARVRFIYPAEEKVLSESIAKEQDLNDYYTLGIFSGMRIGEMRGMRVKHVDLTMRHIFLPSPKNKRSRYVPFDGPQDPEHLIMRMLDRRMAGKGPEDYVMPHWGYTYLKDHFYAICEALDIKNLHIHDWRHTFAYNYLSQGADIYTVSQLMGHSSIDVTQKHYGHLAMKDLRRAMESVRPFLSCNRIATGDHILSEVKEKNDSKS